MQIHPEQLVPGCVLLKQVMGKSRHPIIKKDTVLQEKHILVLKHFGIDSVEVANKLHNGVLFDPVPHQPKKQQTTDVTNNATSFDGLYVEAVKTYQVSFREWQGGKPIDLPYIKRKMMPLFEYVCHYNLDLFSFQKYATAQDYYSHHAVAVSLLSIFIAKRTGYKKKELIEIGLTAILADCGMSKIPEYLYKTNREISTAEFEEVKKHPGYSYRMVENLPTLTREMKLGILQHHERTDGNGYPLKVRDEKIHPFAKIIAISDTYHAMTSERIYREKQSPFQVIEKMLLQKYKKFDYPLLDTFIRHLMNYSIGTRIKLSTGEEAIIIFINDHQLTRPLIRIERTSEIIELAKHQSIFIDEIIKS